ASTKHKRNKAKSHFPSIGGSPTRDESNFKFPLPPQRTTLVAKKPLSVANSVGVTSAYRRSNILNHILLKTQLFKTGLYCKHTY
ncbi:unnamed protein product, partial [Schistosoma margrebowiei]